MSISHHRPGRPCRVTRKRSRMDRADPYPGRPMAPPGHFPWAFLSLLLSLEHLSQLAFCSMKNAYLSLLSKVANSLRATACKNPTAQILLILTCKSLKTCSQSSFDMDARGLLKALIPRNTSFSISAPSSNKPCDSDECGLSRETPSQDHRGSACHAAWADILQPALL